MALRERAGVTGSIPRRIDPRNEPWPDLRVPRPRPDRHREPPAGPPDVRLAADVPKSSLDDARSVTAPLFAAAGVDLADLSR
jgi:hypothetical protein